MCPTYYSDDRMLDIVFGERPSGYLEELGRRLDPAVGVYWTGEEICCREFGCGHLARVAHALQRKPTLWDNYPVNDGPRMSRDSCTCAASRDDATQRPLTSRDTPSTRHCSRI
jgi:hyaluronoglucosaminidase